ELKPDGACRVCIIEVEQQKKLISSCNTPVKKGAVVHTESDRVKQARMVVIELLLASHRPDCVICEKTGACKVQQLATKYVPEIEIRKYRGTRPRINLHENNVFFELNYSACIRCGLCVRAVNEIQVCGVLTMTHRGFDTYPSPDFGKTFEEAGCVSCGNCVAVCPSGALVAHDFKKSSKVSELDRITSTCTYCGVGCQFDILINRHKNEIEYIDSNKNNVVNGLALCVKGRYGWDFVHHSERLNVPLIKKDGKFTEASWEEAFDLIEQKLMKIKKESGSNSLAFLTSAKCTNEENYLMQKLARAGFKTNNVDHCARLCHASTVTGLAKAFGSGAMTNSISDLTNSAEVIFIIGSNTTEAHPVIGSKMKHAVAQGLSKLIVADPRRIELADYSEVFLQHLPGSDVALINAMLKVIIDEGLVDEKFIEEKTEGYKKLKESLDKISLELQCKIANVSVENVKTAAVLYAQATTAAIVYSMGITQHTTGTDNVLSLANLAMVTGNIGRPGTGVNPLRGQNNVQGACDVGGLPDVYPGYQQVSDSNIKAKFEKAWKVKTLDNKPGLTIVEMMLAAHKGKVRGMYIMGENPALSDPNLNHVREALEKVEFLVVQDIFITETAKYADVILPGKTFAEKDGTFTNTERRIQRVRKAVGQIGDRKDDWDILQIMLNRFGIKANYQNPSEIMDEISEISPIYAGIDYTRIEEIGLQWPCKDKKHPGTKILHQGEFSRGKGKFHIISYIKPAELPDDEYPLILTTGRILYHFHTGEMSRRSKGLHESRPIERSQINLVDAERLNIKDGDRIFIESRRGKIETTARVTDNIQEGVVFMSFHYKESAANLLTNDALDPLAKIPEFKVCAIKIGKV
ncbi:MAG: formate dehydrogenase subunit alpha, partial [Candidatus Heimdallarchaeaceae archaeon]